MEQLYGKTNNRGDRLVDFCVINDLIITNTQFKQNKVNRIWSWQSPNGRDHNHFVSCTCVSKNKQKIA